MFKKYQSAIIILVTTCCNVQIYSQLLSPEQEKIQKNHLAFLAREARKDNIEQKLRGFGAVIFYGGYLGCGVLISKAEVNERPAHPEALLCLYLSAALTPLMLTIPLVFPIKRRLKEALEQRRCMVLEHKKCLLSDREMNLTDLNSVSTEFELAALLKMKLHERDEKLSKKDDSNDRCLFLLPYTRDEESIRSFQSRLAETGKPRLSELILNVADSLEELADNHVQFILPDDRRFYFTESGIQVEQSV